MAQPVDLDPNGYEGTYKLIGGSLALDFANLVSYRATDRAHDWLQPRTNVERWLAAADLRPGRIVDANRLVALRETIAGCLLAVTDGEPPLARDLGVLADIAGQARSRHELHWNAAQAIAEWVLPDAALDDLVAVDAVWLLTDPDRRGRLRACEECRWLFLDLTRNRSRRYCDPADCGNRARQRRFAQRQS